MTEIDESMNLVSELSLPTRMASLHKGDRRFLQNLAPEVRTTAKVYFDQIEKRLNALPEKTRRRPLPKPVKTRSAQGRKRR